MPQYRFENDWNGLKVFCRPKSFIRKTFRFWPYHVGQKIVLTLSVKSINNENNLSLANYNVLCKLPGLPEEKTLITFRGETDSEVFFVNPLPIRHIGSEGDIEYRLCFHKDFDKGLPIFTTKAVSPDTRINLIVLTLISSLLGLFIREVWNFILSLFN